MKTGLNWGNEWPWRVRKVQNWKNIILIVEVLILYNWGVHKLIFCRIKKWFLKDNLHYDNLLQKIKSKMHEVSLKLWKLKTFLTSAGGLGHLANFILRADIQVLCWSTFESLNIWDLWLEYRLYWRVREQKKNVKIEI